MKKIGVIVSRIDRGAAELLETRLAIELNKMNLEVVLIPEYSLKKFNDVVYQMELKKKYGLKILRLNIDNRFNSIKQLLKIRSLNLDVIISHNKGGHLISSIISLGKKTIDIKVMHSYYSFDDTKSLMNKLWKLCLQKANFTFHISKKVLDKNILVFKLSREKSVIVRNAIEMENDLDAGTNFNIAEGKKIILSVARIHKDKGYINNLEVVIPVLRSRNDIIYVIAGNTSADPILFKKIKRIIKENEISDKVYFLGQVKNIYGLMDKANVLLHMADKEGFGLVLIEALNTGLPIVSSDIGGIPEVLCKTEFEQFNKKSIEQARVRLIEYVDGFNKKECKERYNAYVNKFSHKNRAASFIEKISPFD